MVKWPDPDAARMPPSTRTDLDKLDHVRLGLGRRLRVLFQSPPARVPPRADWGCIRIAPKRRAKVALLLFFFFCSEAWLSTLLFSDQRETRSIPLPARPARTREEYALPEVFKSLDDGPTRVVRTLADSDLSRDAPAELLVRLVVPQCDQADRHEVRDVAVHVEQIELDVQNHDVEENSE